MCPWDKKILLPKTNQIKDKIKSHKIPKIRYLAKITKYKEKITQ